MVAHYGAPIDEIQCTSSVVPDEVYSSQTPLILRGLVGGWPLVTKALESDRAVIDYLHSFYHRKPVSAFMAMPEAEGRIFYNESVDGFNFVQAEVYLDDVLNKINEISGQKGQPTYYVGSLEMQHHLPGLNEQNSLPIKHEGARKSIWLGNYSVVAPHFDFPDNLACCVIGERRFTLFPPEQQSNLYIGPLDFTPAGQAISMVNVKAPDLQKHPRFETAMTTALTATLSPGDAIYIPSMWWHSVESLGALNGLVNYWWRDTPAYLGSPQNALLHAILSIKQLPKSQRAAWRNLFDHYVFEQPTGMYDHLPDGVKQNQAKVSETTARKIRAQLMNNLK